MARATLAVIVGNRDFFPDKLVTEARRDLLALFTELDIEPILLDETATKLGGVETWNDAKRCADLFRQHASRIDGILVCLPNFGDEKGVADTIKLSGLNVPILVQAYPDNLDAFTVERRRDAFCGKVSVCNNLRQYGFPFTLTAQHTVHPATPAFRQDLLDFLGVCRVVNGLRTARLGAVGARPTAFNTVRYSEKLLQASGMSVQTLDLSEVLGWVARMGDDDNRVAHKLAEIKAYADYGSVPPPSLVKMAKLGVAIEGWMDDNDLDATAIQCWTSLQRNFGVNVCTIMSIMSERLLPSACEVDIAGVVSMYALQLASGTPSALVDWNNNYGDDPNKCVFFHCGNWAKAFIPDAAIKTAPILGTTLGEENTFGAMAGRTPAGPVTFARITTDDVSGVIRSYVGEGRFTDDRLDTFGTRAVVQVPGLQPLMKYICKNGFEHHVAMNASLTSAVLAEAFTTYFNWDVYAHSAA
ncbi:MAG: L-fucose/L-arabinose isomerase family protein [Caldilineaceae bacterium]|nr:L-fucose/L-arabinose isomerase family protein [Caldilineaceae bacterium]